MLHRNKSSLGKKLGPSVFRYMSLEVWAGLPKPWSLLFLPGGNTSGQILTMSWHNAKYFSHIKSSWKAWESHPIMINHAIEEESKAQRGKGICPSGTVSER